MDEELAASSPKMLFVSAVRSVSTTEASDTFDVISRASLTVRLERLQVQRQSEDFLLCVVLTPRLNDNVIILDL